MSINQSSYAIPRLDLGQAFMEYWQETDPMALACFDALPMYNVNAKSGSFSKITRESTAALEDLKRAPTSAYTRLDTIVEDDNYSCQEYGAEKVISDAKRAQYMNDFDVELEAVRRTTGSVLRAINYAVSNKLWDAAVSWLSTNADLYTDVTSAPWDNTGSDIIGHVQAASVKVRGNTGVMPNALILGVSALDNVLTNAAILARLSGVQLATRQALIDALPGIFGLDRIIVGNQFYNSAKEGQTFSGTDMWGDNYAMVAKVASPGDGLDSPCIGRTMLWTEDSPTMVVVEQYREEQTRSDVIRARVNIDPVIIDPYFGHLLLIDA